MTLAPSVSNVLGVYRNSTADNIREGMDWYLAAHNFCKILDPNNVERAAGIVAALSPMNAWPVNMKAAAKTYTNGTAAGTHTLANVRKADRILNGEAPLDVLGGLKVRSFFETIADPYSVTVSPVIDRHAFDIAVGKKTDDETRKILSRKTVYFAFADTYREAAKIVGIGSAQMQAVTWVAWRQIHGIAK